MTPPNKPDPLALAFEARGISPWRQKLSARFMRSYMGLWGFVADHWLLILNLVNGFCLAGAFGAPLLAAAGWDGPANALYTLFGYVCAQNPHHSFFIADRQMCLCQRCMAIYGGMLIFGLGFYLVRRRVRPLSFGKFALFFFPPILLDALTQLFGWRESTWELRFLTGAWLALGAVWTIYPLAEKNMGRLRGWSRREQNLSTKI